MRRELVDRTNGKEAKQYAKKWRRRIKIAINGRVEGRQVAIFALHKRRGRAA